MAVERTFVDTNILLCAHDVGAGSKREAAARALAQLWETRAGAISTQVCQEFVVNATRKLTTPLSRGRAIEILEPHGVWAFHRPGLPDVLAAVTLAEDNQLSFWDAMIVRSAVQVGATRLYSEDLNDGQLIAGVRVENPLRRPLVAQS